MSISAEQLAGLLESLGPLPDGSTRRRAKRVKLQGWVYISIDDITPEAGLKLDDQGRVKARFADISARGVRLLSPCRIPASHYFLLHLPRGFKNTTNLLCHSQHCKSVRPGVYSVGAEFVCAFREPGDDDENQRRRISSVLLS